jgi:hypothetical protein
MDALDFRIHGSRPFPLKAAARRCIPADKMTRHDFCGCATVTQAFPYRVASQIFLGEGNHFKPAESAVGANE